MKKVLILVLSNVNHDARVRRQLFALKNQYRVTLVCFGGKPSDEYELITITPTRLTLLRKAITSVFLLLRIHPVAYSLLHNYKFIVHQLRDQKFDLIIANDVETLPLAFAFPGNPKVLFDAHEYAPRHFEDKRMWRLFFQNFNLYLCKKYIPRLAGMMTVGKGLAREYEKNFGVRPTVITNANSYFEISPTPLQPDRIRLVHHGIATPSRQLEIMIDMMPLLDNRFTLDLILLTPGFASRETKNYLQVLKEKIKGNEKIRILPPVESSQVVQRINEYDMGVFLLPPINFNYENTLPNKLFDFIQARLGIAIGPTPEMAEIVVHYANGVVSEKFTAGSLAIKLNSLTREDIANFKKNSSLAAHDLNAEKNSTLINALVAAII